MKTKEYSNGEVTIVWKPEVCIHAAKCANGLPGVFNPKARPWINAEGSTTEEITKTIDKCPSGALSYYFNNIGKDNQNDSSEICIELAKNGPLLVHGTITLKDADGNETVREKKTALCRCGASANKPFCDGKHKKIGFEG